MDASDGHCSKAVLPMDVIVEGKVTDVRLGQSLKMGKSGVLVLEFFWIA
ncbi:MAG: hypothetical protein RR672_08590 [Raoultibacter sp.]